MFPKKQKSSKKVQDVLCLNVKKENKVRDEKKKSGSKLVNDNGFFNIKKLRNQAKSLEDVEFFAVKKHIPDKGIKKLVRREQVRLQEKRQQRKKSNTKVQKNSKKPKLDKS